MITTTTGCVIMWPMSLFACACHGNVSRTSHFIQRTMPGDQCGSSVWAHKRRLVRGGNASFHFHHPLLLHSSSSISAERHKVSPATAMLSAILMGGVSCSKRFSDSIVLKTMRGLRALQAICNVPELCLNTLSANGA